jgi:hypothetical protein
MYGKKGRNEPFWTFFARGALGDITFEHAKAGPKHGEIADNISDRPTEYKDYQYLLMGIYNNKKFVYNKEVTNSLPSLAIFDYVQKNGKTKENNIFLLSSYINLTNGTKSFSSTNSNQIKLLEGYFKEQGISYTRSEKSYNFSTGSASAVVMGSSAVITNYTITVNQ